MTPSFCLVYHWLVALRINVLNLCLATIVEQELGFIEVFLFASKHIKTSQSHLSNLMTWHHTSLTFASTNLLDDTIGITLGYVQELIRTCRLIVSTGSIDHVTQVVKLVTCMFLCSPTLISSPSVWMLWVNGTSSIEVAIRLLGSAHHIEHRVDISLQLSVRKGLEHIAGTLDGLIDVSIVEREAHELSNIPFWSLQARMTWVLERIGRHFEVFVTMFALAFRECQRNSYLTGSTDAIAPEGTWRNLYRGERNLGIGIPTLGKSCAHKTS